MILVFPNFDILRLALTAGGIPDAVSASAARAAFDDQGQAWIEPGVPIKPSAQKELHRLGVKSCAASILPLDQLVHCWPQLLPLERQRDLHDRLDEQAVVLFQLAEERQLAELVSEILRLGNDRQGFRWLEQGDTGQALLRVVGPPYYSLLRALDGAGNDAAPVAYREAQPGVWVQLGYRHPLEEHVRPPAGKLLLMRPPRQWTFIAEAPFRDIYEVLDFAAPQPLHAWQEGELGRRWTVPLRLTKGGTMEPAELWVLRGGDGIAQVDEFVQNADEQLLARLAFAVGDKNGERVIVLRVRPSRQSAPVVVLGGIGYRPHLRLPNLFLPCSTRLHPPLRRDVVAKLLAGDPKQITWLHPGSDGRFVPETLADAAFRPLHDWLDYVLDQEQQPLTAWVQAARFDFEPFVCRDDQPAKEPQPRAPKSKKPKDDEVVAIPAEPTEEIKRGRRKKKDDVAVDEAVAARPNEAEQSLRALEKEFLETGGPLDGPRRQALWPRMAQLNGVLKQTESAGICWGHALWEADAPAATWLKGWLHAEKLHGDAERRTTLLHDAPRREISQHAERDEYTPSAGELAEIVNQESPSLKQVRVLVAAVVWAGHEASLPADWKPLLGRIPQVLEKHEPLLGVRPIWLAWTALHRLTHGDVLGLARARDRLLERLYVNGLSADLDLPSFLRFTGAHASERYRLVREQVLRLLPIVEKFTQRGRVSVPGTKVYVDLMFAYALARLGETTEARKLLKRGPAQLGKCDQVHQWLIEAFDFRIVQALEGSAAIGRLPDSLMERLENMHDVQEQQEVKPKKQQLDRYKIERMREHSRILEPHERINAAHIIFDRYLDALGRELKDLAVLDKAELLKRLHGLLTGKGKWERARGSEGQIAAAALELAPRLGESFADLVLVRAENLLENLTEPLERFNLLEKGLFLAGHFDKSGVVQNLMGHFQRLLDKSAALLSPDKLESLLGHAFRSLRKLSLRDEVERLLERMTVLIQKHPGLQSKSNEDGMRNRMLLQVAGGLFYFGQENRARSLLDEARTQLFADTLQNIQQTALARAYVSALGQAPVELALNRIMELFRRVDGVYDTYTTHTHFSQSRLDLVETTLLALVSDDFTISPEARRLLDDDEYLVRRRIHRDVRRAMAGAGL